eukprot:Gb_11809 [translate_table: standard]
MKIRHNIKDILEVHIPLGGLMLHKGIYNIINNSLPFTRLSSSSGVIISLAPQHMYPLYTYAFIALKLTTQVARYTNHQDTIGFILMGAIVHEDAFFVRDYNP